jgi:hypothetical protein
MSEWPGPELVAVYDPTRPARPPWTVESFRRRLTEARVDHGVPVTEQIVTELLSQQWPPGEGQLDPFTAEERQELAGDSARVERARRVLTDAGRVLYGIEVCWRSSRRGVRVLVTEEPGRYRGILAETLGADRVVVETARFTADQLRGYQREVSSHAEQLAAQGIFVTAHRPRPSGVAIEYFATDHDRAQAVLQDLFGGFADLDYQGASRYAVRPHPFGSWHADGDHLHVFYALPHNGERPAGCTATELQDSVIVALTILDWRGAKTLRGGFTPTHATVQLQSSLGERAVIDNAQNVARPHWRTAAEIRLPRPQDL